MVWIRRFDQIKEKKPANEFAKSLIKLLVETPFKRTLLSHTSTWMRLGVLHNPNNQQEIISRSLQGLPSGQSHPEHSPVLFSSSH